MANTAEAASLLSGNLTRTPGPDLLVGPFQGAFSVSPPTSARLVNCQAGSGRAGGDKQRKVLHGRSAGQNERQIPDDRLKNVTRNRAVASANFTNAACPSAQLRRSIDVGNRTSGTLFD